MVAPFRRHAVKVEERPRPWESSPMPAARRLTVSLPLDLYRRAVKQAKVERRSVAGVIRIALERYLAEQQDKEKK
jgi:hypothetical protein